MLLNQQMKRVILKFGKKSILWLSHQRWFVHVWRCCFGIKILHLPAFSLRDFTPAQMIKIPEFQINKHKQNHLFDSFKQTKPMRDDKSPIAVRIIADAVVIAGMPFYISDNKIWIRENFDFDYSELEVHLLFRSAISQFYYTLTDRQVALSARYLQAERAIDKGISLLPAIDNYWHFMFEQAPKILLSEMAGIPDDVPLLLPDNLYHTFYDIVDALNQGKREVICLPALQKSEWLRPKNNKVIKINKLYHIGDISNLITYCKSDFIFTLENYQHHTQCNMVRLMVKKLLDGYNITPKADSKIKLFVKRNSFYRIPQNQEKLEQFFVKHGWIVFEPEKHSFAEQVDICSRASAFFAFRGAALTNALFLPAEAKKIIFWHGSLAQGQLLPAYQEPLIWDILLENAYLLQNAFIPDFAGDGHGTPYLSEKNWQDLQEIISRE
ncbi:MAG: glycosyltransferase family 61 protein [Alphaproteobacteria bacterium]|nr:glycosyltransferase family 61 protein [Alphaproteobacteria bacterium]